MGFDIDIFLEYQEVTQQDWSMLARFRPPRNDRLFSHMAGVRGTAGRMRLYRPRGMPEDVSEAVREAYHLTEDSGHSHTWLDREEYMHCVDVYLAVDPQPAFGYQALLAAMDLLKKQGVRARIVFWFYI